MVSTVHPACMAVAELLKDCRIKRTRGSGPGGQHRNKVETAIVITHVDSGISGSASERRSQAQNQSLAVHRLRINLAIGLPPANNPVAVDQWRQRTGKGSIQVNRNHGDFPCMVAIALNTIFAAEFKMAPAAQKLGCTTSQLIKFLKLDDNVLTAINRHRQQHDLGPLK